MAFVNREALLAVGPIAKFCHRLIAEIPYELGAAGLDIRRLELEDDAESVPLAACISEGDQVCGSACFIFLTAFSLRQIMRRIGNWPFWLPSQLVLSPAKFEKLGYDGLADALLGFE